MNSREEKGSEQIRREEKKARDKIRKMPSILKLARDGDLEGLRNVLAAGNYDINEKDRVRIMMILYELCLCD